MSYGDSVLYFRRIVLCVDYSHDEVSDTIYSHFFYLLLNSGYQGRLHNAHLREDTVITSFNCSERGKKILLIRVLLWLTPVLFEREEVTWISLYQCHKFHLACVLLLDLQHTTWLTVAMILKVLCQIPFTITSLFMFSFHARKRMREQRRQILHSYI